MPAMTVTRNSADGRSAGGTDATALPPASAAALVVAINIRRVLAVAPPTIGPTALAYSPWIGLMAARTLAAMPSGTLPIAPGNPAIASERSRRHEGRRIGRHRIPGGSAADQTRRRAPEGSNGASPRIVPTR